ncbi:DEAD/DEAH box helicase [Acrocarpospora sp. B8E8]|uniref:DEAD/DEAH box helicase n=1 Tax=Acrocarpospora sp. B8E8 TaxID=3153572 RepID=UPI00325CE9F3
MSPPLYRSLLDRLRQPVDLDRAALVDEAAEVWNRPGFDTFVSLPRLTFEPFDYQLAAAQTVVRRMRGRAILADEVGLGKTIEAGLVLSELRVRGLAAKALVITPAGLVGQWGEELGRKFALPTTVATGKGWEGDGSVVLASLAAARRDPLKSLLTAQTWDIVIIDEAHRVRGPRSASGKLARQLRGRYYLLLTATPVENKLQDLYELISIVSPGLLGTAAQFKARHGAGTDTPRQAAELRARTREVMVRHRRSEVSVLLPQRLAETVLITPAQEESSFYADLLARIRAEAAGAPHGKLFSLRALAKLAGSSPAAAAPTLAKLGWAELAGRAGAVHHHEKTAELLRRLAPFVERGEKVLVFTAYRQTLDTVAKALSDAGIPAGVYHGSLGRHEKDATIAAFAGDVPVLLSTESAGEGRNLQFCHVMINMDLPWNPMQIEQRLGRLHRVGQTHDVLLTNLVTRATVEQRILRILEAKINMFELVIGELDMILGRVEEDFDFETSVFDALISSSGEEEFGQKLDMLGEEMARARTDYLSGRGAIDALVGDD